MVHTKVNIRRKIFKLSMLFDIVDYDYMASIEYGKIRANLEKRGKVIGGMDMQIAAHALSLKFTLVSNDTREFERVNGLKLENWV